MKNRFYSPDQHSSNNTKKKEKQLISSQVIKVNLNQGHKRLNRFDSLSIRSKKIGNYKYEISNQIGRGYSSIVYKGVNTKTQQQVAIKAISLEDCSQSNIKMLENEIKILRSLDHPNIIKCYDIYKTQLHYYIITQYCSQGDLFTFITKHKRIHQVAAINIMNQIISGVKYLMGKNIIHRDLKPANILKSSNGWKIADFGFSTISSKHMKSKYNVGTPLYMPLQSLIDNVYSPKSDIFSVGIIFYQLLTGTTPWECRQEKDLIQRLKTIPYHFPETVEVSKAMKQILESLCAVIYQERIQKQDFMQLNLTYISVNPEEKLLTSNPYQNKLDPKDNSKILTLDKLNRNKSALNVSLKKKEDLSIDSKTETKNNHILVNQLHYCRFIYYYIKNMKYLRVSPKNQTKLTLVMFKHLEKLVLLLTDRENNNFKLSKWQAFRETKKFYSTSLTMKEYSSRYSKEYMDYLKGIDMQTIQTINKDFHHLTLHDTFTQNCHSQIMTFVSSLIREANHNLTIQTKNLEEPISTELKAGIEALKFLFKYYKLINLSSNNFQDFQLFQKKSHIRVQIDFTNCNNTLEIYSSIRDELKFM